MPEDTLEDWEYVLSAEGAGLLDWIAGCGLADFALARELRARTTPSRAALLTLTAQLRQKAAAKFSRAASMFFTRSALEQASAEVVAAHRAGRYARAGVSCVADLCCGAGGDALALAEHCRVLAVDQDAARLLMAAANLRAYGREQRLTLRQADVTELDPASLGADAFFIDPARRGDNGERIFDPRECLPPLSEILRWQRSLQQGCAKLGPGVDQTLLPPDCEVEFISVAGELREAACWFGRLRSGEGTTATVFPSGRRLAGGNPEIGCGAVGDWLYEPDPAVIRAGLVQRAGSLLQARMLDPQIAFLTGEADPAEAAPFVRGWRVEQWLPYDERELKKRLRAIGAGNLYLKKRGVSVDLDALKRRLKVAGKESRLVVLTRMQDKPIALICQI